MEANRHKKHHLPIFKKLEGYLSFKKGNNDHKSKAKAAKYAQVVPTGCFAVRVGPEMQRFVIKTEYVNHPLFKMLLEDAESEYGFINEGPLMLPCEVNLFCKVLAAMDDGAAEDWLDDVLCSHTAAACGGFAYGSCSPFCQGRRAVNHETPYERIAPLRLLTMHDF